MIAMIFSSGPAAPSHTRSHTLGVRAVLNSPKRIDETKSHEASGQLLLAIKQIIVCGGLRVKAEAPSTRILLSGLFGERTAYRADWIDSGVDKREYCSLLSRTTGICCETRR